MANASTISLVFKTINNLAAAAEESSALLLDSTKAATEASRLELGIPARPTVTKKK